MAEGKACQIFQSGYWKLVLLWEPHTPFLERPLLALGSGRGLGEPFTTGGGCWWQRESPNLFLDDRFPTNASGLRVCAQSGEGVSFLPSRPERQSWSHQRSMLQTFIQLMHHLTWSRPSALACHYNFSSSLWEPRGSGVALRAGTGSHV